MRFDRQPRRGEDRGVVGPGRRSDPDDGVRAGGADEFGAEPQRSGAAGSLKARDPAGEPVARPEDVRLQQCDKADVALRAQIFLAVLGLEEDTLGLLDGLQHRSNAPRVAVDPDAEVDLSGAPIGIERLDQAEQAVGRLGVERFKHGDLSPDRQPVRPP